MTIRKWLCANRIPAHWTSGRLVRRGHGRVRRAGAERAAGGADGVPPGARAGRHGGVVVGASGDGPARLAARPEPRVPRRRLIPDSGPTGRNASVSRLLLTHKGDSGHAETSRGPGGPVGLVCPTGSPSRTGHPT